MVPDDDQAMVLPCASVMVIMVLLKVALTCATPEEMFLRSRRRGLPRVPVCGSLAMSSQAPVKRQGDEAARTSGSSAVRGRPRGSGGRLLFSGDGPRLALARTRIGVGAL